MPNPFSILGAKIFAGVAAAAIAFGTVQTIRIEGAFCRQVKAGEKPACIYRGFKQEIAVIRIDLEQVRRDRDAERKRASDEAASHKQTKKNYRDAQDRAAKLEQERLARVGGQQKEISDANVKDYRGRIARARTAAERLRKQPDAAGSGAAGAGGALAVPGVSDGTRGADGAAGDRRLSLDERLVATETAIRLEKLQDWVREQAGVSNN